MNAREKAQLTAYGRSGMIRLLPPADKAEVVGQALAMAAGVSLDSARVNPMATDLLREGTSLAHVMDALGGDIKAAVTSHDLGAAVGEALNLIWLDQARTRLLDHRRLCRMLSVPNFQTRTIPSQRPVSLGTITESGEIPEIVQAPIGLAECQLQTVGGILQFSRQAILAADWPLLASITQELVDAADRAERQAVFGLLNANPVLADGVPMFDPSRGNIAATTGAPSVATLESAMIALGSMTENGARLAMQPAMIVVPTGYATTAAVLMNAGLDRLLAGQDSPIIYDPSLTDAWYLLPDPASRPVVGLAHLGNARDPIIDRKAQFTSDGISIRCRHSYGACALSPHAVKVPIA